MSRTWTISVNARSYGPYTAEQMHAFAAEGRLAAHSLVARAGAQQFSQAADDDELAPLFRVAAQPTPARPVFFTAEGDEGVQHFNRPEDHPAERSHYIIVADMKSRSIAGLEEEIYKFGTAYPILPQAWLVSSDLSINAMRNTLVQQLGKLDMLFIVDASHDKAAWFNFGPEADTRIRRVWQKLAEAAPQRATG